MAFFLVCLLCLVLLACGKRKILVGVDKRVLSTPLFIEMPKNVLVFDDISIIIYEALWDQFDRAGYDLHTERNEHFRLSTKIKNLQEIAKLISPDVLTYGFRIRLELECVLFDPDNKLFSEKTFIFFKWIAKPKSPVLHYHFIREQYKELVGRSVPKIDHYFRKILWQFQKQT